MSASLVGSEMCIRDSSRSGHGGGQAAPCSGRAASPVGTLLAVARAAPPVSYTHLTLPTICSV
eukprot:2648346-Alexandrium_andersonii.AAC.1